MKSSWDCRASYPQLLLASLLLASGCGDDAGQDGATDGDRVDSSGDSIDSTTSGTGATGASDSSSGGNTGSGSAAGGGSTGSGGTGSGSTGSGGTGGGEASTSRTACKRGVAYGHHSLADMTVLSKGVSWWYNWHFRPDSAVSDGSYLDVDVDYLPMIWGANSDRDAASSQIPDDALTLLGFNEPNFGEQANMTAAAAAALWPELETIADARGLALVSPAVNYCGGDCVDTDPFGYLDDFFAACTDCRVDAVAFHIYVGCSPSGDNKAEWLINHVETYKTRFTQPLWLTEFACNDATSLAVQQEFLEDAVAYLEAEPRIERYAWFAGRADNVPYVDLLGEDGELTTLGQAYVDAPQPDGCVR